MNIIFVLALLSITSIVYAKLKLYHEEIEVSYQNFMAIFSRFMLDSWFDSNIRLQTVYIDELF